LAAILAVSPVDREGESMRRNHARGAFGRLGSLVIAGVVTSAVVAAIAFAANGQGAGQALPAAGQVKLGSDPAFPMLAYSWGVSNSGSSHAGGGGGAGTANVQDISFTKATGSTTVELLTSVTTGTHYPEVVVTAKLEGTATMVYELDNVIVTSVSLGGSGSEKSPLENVTLNFAKVTWTHTDAAGISTSGSFDAAAGTP
jgi:type VI secretion system secreted protein Hcp